MSNSVATLQTKGPKTKITLRSLYDEITHLRERVEDLEDLRELNEAIVRNKDKRLIPWEHAKKDLGLGG